MDDDLRDWVAGEFQAVNSRLATVEARLLDDPDETPQYRSALTAVRTAQVALKVA